ncbi:MAG: hypothetical protein H6742_13940 [Alphaproteobacteria bacterium]|nr:hypothetical protein [Alphaproteobacteria bacterium]
MQRQHLVLLLGPVLLSACREKVEYDFGNEAPSAPEISLSPTAPSDDDDLTVSITSEASDPDGDALSYKYSWYLDGELRADFTSSRVPAGITRKGQTWSVEVRAWDGRAKSEAATAQVSIINALPELTVSISPTEVGTDGSLKALASAMDPDGEEVTVTYSWYVDGDLQAYRGDTLDGELYFDKGQDVYCEVTGVDPDGGEASATSETVTVGNTAPSAPGVDIVPANPLVDDDFVCLITGGDTDRDGEAISYVVSWTRNGSAYTATNTTTYTGDTITAAETEDGDIFECSAYATDGEENSISRTASAEVISWEGPRDFGPCDQTGQTGPDQSMCDDAYAGTLLDGFVTVNDGIQEWTVPSTGSYVITACGAQGAGAATTNDGGQGACVDALFELEEGAVLYIAIGQNGTGEDSGSNGGGGGGTFVVAEGDEPLLIAGGGAGTRTGATMDGCPGRDDEYGGDGGSSSTSSCPASSVSLGQGGGIASSSYGAGGAGFDGDGSSDYGTGGLSWANGLTGGNGYSCGTSAPGGFGGGGSGNGCYGGGGGGGYTGGDGGYMAGGGGSYSAGTDTVMEAGAGDGAGWVTIDIPY